MAFARPTLAQIRRRVQSDFQHAFKNDAVLYPGTIEYAFCEAIVGLSHAKHGRLDQIYRDSFPHLASEPALVKWAADYNMFPNKAAYAEGPVRIYGVAGTAIPNTTILARQADGFEYRTLQDEVIGGSGFVDALSRARVPGVAGNYESSLTNQLALQTSIGGVVSIAESVIPHFTGGSEAETPAELRVRLLELLASPPGGGQTGDYIRWAKLVTGVTRAWEYGNTPSIGYVTVLFMRDGDTDPFPGAPEIADVLAQINEFAPIALPEPIVQSPIEAALTIEIELTIEPGAVQADVEAAVSASIIAMIRARAEPAPADGTPFYRSWISEAISTTSGELDHKLNLPAADVSLFQWQIVTTDPTITFV